MPRLSAFNDGYSSEIQKQFGINPEYKNSIMSFCQAAAPTGWLRDTTDNDCMLRITNGSTISTGGNSPFQDVLWGKPDIKEFSGGPVNLSAAIGGWNLTTDQIPRHVHRYSVLQEKRGPVFKTQPPQWISPAPSGATWVRFDALNYLPDYRPYANSKVEPVSGAYPTNFPDIRDMNGYDAHYQYYPGRFNDAGDGGSHTHTISNAPINWKGTWDMRVKYIDAIFAKYTG